MGLGRSTTTNSHSALTRCPHGQKGCRYVCIRSGADILQIDHHDVDPLEHVVCGRPEITIEREDRESGGRVDGMVDVGLVEGPTKPMFRTEERV